MDDTYFQDFEFEVVTKVKVHGPTEEDALSMLEEYFGEVDSSLFEVTSTKFKTK